MDNFLKGIGSILNIFGELKTNNFKIKSDWEAVSNDFKKVINYEKK